MNPIFILAFIGIIKLCGAPAVSLSFSSKSKSGANVSSVFAFKNGSWVAVNPPHASKGVNSQNSQVNKDSNDGLLKASLTSDVEDLFRKINRTIPLKLLPASLTEAPTVVTKSVSVARVGSTEKSLGDLFLEWLSKQEEMKPVAAKSSTIPVLGLQIDFDEGKNTQRPVTNHEMAHYTTRAYSYSPAQFKVSFRESPIFIHGIRKALARPTESVQPFSSHVKKRHQQGFNNRAESGEEHDRPSFSAMKSTLGTDTEEFHSGQLLVHNEISNDKKHKVNDLPKYVMKFLSQCKALIEQNYDDEVGQGVKENDDDDDDDDGLLNVGRSDQSRNKPNYKNHEKKNPATIIPVTEPAVTHPTYVDDNFNDERNDEDEFESLTINKKARGKIGKIERKKTNSSKKAINDRFQADQDDADDLYDGAFDEEVQDLNVGESIDSLPNGSTNKVTKQAYFSSETNVSCRPILEQFTPERETYTADCSTPVIDFSTLNPMQWKVLMDFLNERMPSTCTQKSTCTTGCTRSTCTKTCTSRSTCTTSASTCASKPACTTPTTTTTRPSCTSTTTACSAGCNSTTPSTSTTNSSKCPSPCGDCDDEPVGPADDRERQSNAKTGKSPQRYLIKIETTKPKRFHEGLMQGRKPSNWFENIRNLKLLEGLKSPSPNTVKPVYYNLHSNPNESPVQTPANNDDIEDNTEKMIAEGVIPLKTGSTLNLYISYVLNKTKARRSKLPLMSHQRRHTVEPNPVTHRPHGDFRKLEVDE